MSYGSLIQYILNEKKMDKETVVTHNLRGETVDEYSKEYALNENFRQGSLRSDSVYFSHEIISFNNSENAENFTPEALKTMINQYIQMRGEVGMYIAAVHRDTEHVHIHLMVSACEYRTGKSFHIARPDLYKLKIDFQKYHREQFPGIKNSFPTHGKGKPYLTDRAWQKENRVKRNEIKENIRINVEHCLSQSNNFREFLGLLRIYKLEHYGRSGRVEGVTTSDGMKFRFSRLASEINLTDKIESLTNRENMKSKDNLKDENLSEYTMASLESRIKENGDKLDLITDRINQMYMEVQDTETNIFNQDQKLELEELEEQERRLLLEREELDFSRQVLAYELDAKEKQELDQIRAEETTIAHESGRGFDFNDIEMYDSSIDQVGEVEVENLNEAEIDELSNLEESRQVEEDLENELNRDDEF